MNPMIIRLIRRSHRIVRYSSNAISSYFITAPIFYVNGPPHIGHLYTALLADASHRWHLMKSETKAKSIFSIGTDEHGLKIQQSALVAGMDPLDYCNNISKMFQMMFAQFDVGHTDFIRTTERRHVDAVHHFWNKLMATGLVYKDKYRGWYSYVDEAFYSDSEVKDIVDEKGVNCKVSITTGSKVELSEETNYMFAMSKFAEKLRTWWTESDVIQPSSYLSAAISLLDTGGCNDLSLSRESRRLYWAIGVPGDDTQRIYVWFDALINYLTVAGYPNSLKLWPPDCQLLGVDILRFHAIIWPALLMALDLPLPKKLFVHGHWLCDGVKMSKSKGNVVDPVQESSALSVEGLRYFLLRQGVPHDDANYSRPAAIQTINDELANNLGNLASRATGMKINKDQLFPPFHAEVFDRDYADDGPALVDGLHYMTDKIIEHYDQLYFYKGVQLIMAAIRQTNAFYQYHAPWSQVDPDGNPRSEESRRNLHTTIHVTYQALRLCGLFLQPIIPALASRLLYRLGIPDHERSLRFCTVFDKCPIGLENKPLGRDRKILFSRIHEK